MTWAPRIYISGPITKGDRNKNFYQASIVEKQLMQDGFAPLNPMRSMIVPHAHDADLPHEIWMQSDLPWVEVADAVLRLPGASVGADAECAHAIETGIPVFYSVTELRHWRAVECRLSLTEKKSDMADPFTVKDSGKRATFASGMVRDTTEGKADYTTVFNGPMLDRWAEHLTKGAQKYPNDPDGTPNWTKAEGLAELNRFRASAARHFRQWLRGDRDEDHAAAVFFNLNGAEYVREKMANSAESRGAA